MSSPSHPNLNSNPHAHAHTNQNSSTTNIPTLHSLHPMKRSISYSPDTEDDHSNSRAHSPTTTSKPKTSEPRVNDHLVKAALTELLNDDGVRSNARGSRSVQNFLMDTEHALREQRRQSLSERVGSISVLK